MSFRRRPRVQIPASLLTGGGARPPKRSSSRFRPSVVVDRCGKVTTFSGKVIRYGQAHADQREGLLASNGVLHEAALERLKGTF